jgi:hypothetical protein
MFTETACIQPAFFTGLGLLENQVYHSKERYGVKIEQYLLAVYTYYVCMCTRFLALNDTGIHTSRYAYMHAAHTNEP